MELSITDEMVETFKRAAFDRMMSDDGCPEGEATRAGLEAVAPLIRAQALEEAARISDDAGDCVDGADISDAIRALKGGGS